MKLAAGLLAASLVLTSFGVTPVKADDQSVFVTIVNGDVKLAQAKLSLTDADGDGALTINDALILAHDSAFEGGAAAGYLATEGAWGLSISKLWGVENGGSYGYYLNNVSAMGLTDPVKNGDYLTAFVYQDTTAFSDAYAYFDVNTKTVAVNEEVTLTLSAVGFDESWNPVSKPVENANIYVNDVPANTKTDANGTVNLGTMQPGTYVITADSDTAILVKPVCTLTVENGGLLISSNPNAGDILIAPGPDSTPKTGDDISYVPAIIACILLLIIVPSLTYIKKRNEK